MEVDVKVREENHEQDFFVETKVITTVVHRVRANNFEQAKSLVERGLVRSEYVVDSTADRIIKNVTQKYYSIFNAIKENLKGDK